MKDMNAMKDQKKKPVVITTDSTADISRELQERFQIRIIPLTVTLGEESYLDGVGFTRDDIYARYHADGILPQTAAPGIDAFLDFFGEILQEGCEIVHLDISSELSNICNVARLAAESLEDVHVVDSRMLSSGIALLAIEGAECRDRGMCAEEIAAHLNTLKSKVSTSFVLETLEFMWKGGRCKGVTALGANLLKIRPALEMQDGKLIVCNKYRGKMPGVYRKYITERLTGKKIRPAHIFLTDSGEIDPALLSELEEMIRELSGCREIHRADAGATISSHCGPGCLGVLFIEE